MLHTWQGFLINNISISTLKGRLTGMTSLGILQWSPSEKDYYLKKVALSCVKEGIQVFSISPSDLRINSSIVTGMQFNEKSIMWDRKTFLLPEYIYDRCFYSSAQDSRKDAVAKVKTLKNKVTFLGSGLPNKWAVYQWLKNESSLRNFLPPTQLLSETCFNSYLTTFNKIVIKPVFGSGGKGFYVIKQTGEAVKLYDRENSLILKEKDRATFFKKLKKFLPLLGSGFILQPYMHLQINEQPFDLRVVVQKYAPDKWNIIGQGFRMGKRGMLVSNLVTGGEIHSFNDFPLSFPPSLKKKIKQLSRIIPTVLEKNHSPLFELGIDFGIDHQKRLWILEVNSKPGYETILQTTSASDHYRVFQGPIQLIKELEKEKYQKEQEKLLGSH